MRQLDKGQVVGLFDIRRVPTTGRKIAVDQRGKGGASGGLHESRVRAAGRWVSECRIIITDAVWIPTKPEEAAHVVQRMGTETRGNLQHQDIAESPALSKRLRRVDFHGRRACRHESVACVRRIPAVDLGGKRGAEVDGGQKAEVGEDTYLAPNVPGHKPQGFP